MKIKAIKIISIVLIVSGCQYDKHERAESLLKNPEMRKEIINAMLQDSASLSQFFETFHNQGNQHGNGMRGMHERMMTNMHGSSRMDTLMMADSAMRNRMINHMLNRTDHDSAFCNRMSNLIMRHKPLSNKIEERLSPPRNKIRSNSKK